MSHSATAVAAEAPNEAIDQALAAAALDFSDVLYYSSPEACGGFKRVAEERRRSISVFSRAMQCSPINMMRATVVMPCSPAEFVRYMEPDARVLWDEHYKYGRLIRRVKPLPPPSASASAAGPSPSTASAPATAAGGDQQVGDYPQLKIFEFNSPVPSLVRARDFEMVMSQRVNPADGTALVKGFSTPKGYLLPLQYKRGSEAEGRRAEEEARRQRPQRFREALGIDIGASPTSSSSSSSSSPLASESMRRALTAAQTALAERTAGLPTSLAPPPASAVSEASLPGLVGVPAFDTSSLEATVRGTIVFSGFVATPIFESDTAAIAALPAETQQLIADADRNRGGASGPLQSGGNPQQQQHYQSPHFAYPYVTTVAGKGRIVASRVTYVALIQPQGNVHPLFVNMVVRMQTRGLKQMQRAIVQHPVLSLDAKLGSSGGGNLVSKL